MAEEIPMGWVPEGSVEFVQRHLGRQVEPDYYPAFLEPWLRRRVWREDKWPVGKRVFIKPADAYKRFNGFVTNGGWPGKKRKPYWCSETVEFVNEWRYYVAGGKVLEAGWYQGDEVKEPAPPHLDIDWPADCFGAIDFGELSSGEIALVEYNHPFSAGWYGDDGTKYVEWLCLGWKHMQEKFPPLPPVEF